VEPLLRTMCGATFRDETWWLVVRETHNERLTPYRTPSSPTLLDIDMLHLNL